MGLSRGAGTFSHRAVCRWVKVGLYARQAVNDVIPITETGTAFGPRLVMVGALFVAVAALWVWWTYLGRERLIQDMPTSAVKGVALGMNELVGIVTSPEPAISPQAGLACVWWKNEIFTETGDGWPKTAERHGGPRSFELVDDSGSISVRPQHGEVYGEKVHEGS